MGPGSTVYATRSGVRISADGRSETLVAGTPVRIIEELADGSFVVDVPGNKSMPRAVVSAADVKPGEVEQDRPPDALKAILNGLVERVGGKSRFLSLSPSTQRDLLYEAWSSRTPTPSDAPDPGRAALSGAAAATSSPLVTTAMEYIGKPYRLGAEGPNFYDCSSFTREVLKRNGIRANRTAHEQFRQGSSVSRENLQPGDLVFFERTTSARGITHVGMYVGRGKFIHAANSRRGTLIANLNDSYYNSRYAGARRMSRRR